MFSDLLLDADHTDTAALLRRAARLGDGCETWRLLWQPLAAGVKDVTWPSIAAVEDAQCAAYEAEGCLRDVLQNVRGRSSLASCGLLHADEQDIAELLVGCEFTRLFADRVRLARALTGDGAAGDVGTGTDWIERLNALREKVAVCWMARNKPSGLADIRRALARVADDLRCCWSVNHS
jgi:hypothetical protein